MTAAKHRWIPYAEAWEIVHRRFPDTADSEDILIHAIKAGRVGVRGKRETIPKSNLDIGLAIAFGKGKMPRSFTALRNAKNPPLQHISPHADWGVSGNHHLVADLPGDQSNFEIIYDITINEKDYLNFLNEQLFFYPIAVRDGRKRKQTEWLKVTIAMVYLELADKLTLSEFPDDISLRETIESAVGGLDEKSLRYDVAVLHDIFVKHRPDINWSDYRVGDDNVIDAESLLSTAASRVASKASKT